MYKRGRRATRTPSSSGSLRYTSRSSSIKRGQVMDTEQLTEYKGKPKRPDALRGRPTLRKLTNYVRQNISPPEKKYKFAIGDTTLGAVAASGQPNIAPYFIMSVTRGTTVSTRLADFISLGKGKIKGNIGTSNGNCAVRLMVLLDKKPNGTALTNAVLFNTSTPHSGSFLNFNNLDVMSRFTVLVEKVYTLNNAMLAPSGSNQNAWQHVDLSWDCNDYIASYKLGNAGTIADVDDGAVYILLQQSGAVGPTGSGITATLDWVQYWRDA